MSGKKKVKTGQMLKKKSLYYFPSSTVYSIMSNMEISMAYPASKFEADNTLTNPVVLEKYQLAADIVNGKYQKAF